MILENSKIHHQHSHQITALRLAYLLAQYLRQFVVVQRPKTSLSSNFSNISSCQLLLRTSSRHSHRDIPNPQLSNTIPQHQQNVQLVYNHLLLHARKGNIRGLLGKESQSRRAMSLRRPRNERNYSAMEVS